MSKRLPRCRRLGQRADLERGARIAAPRAAEQDRSKEGATAWTNRSIELLREERAGWSACYERDPDAAPLIAKIVATWKNDRAFASTRSAGHIEGQRFWTEVDAFLERLNP